MRRGLIKHKSRHATDGALSVYNVLEISESWRGKSYLSQPPVQGPLCRKVTQYLSASSLDRVNFCGVVGSRVRKYYKGRAVVRKICKVTSKRHEIPVNTFVAHHNEVRQLTMVTLYLAFRRLNIRKLVGMLTARIIKNLTNRMFRAAFQPAHNITSEPGWSKSTPHSIFKSNAVLCITGSILG
jgi:hypothetical protein